MKAIKSWLEDYVKIDFSDQELVEKLNLTGTEVDTAASSLDDKIIVVEIKEIKKHPNADRLSLVTVFDGQKKIEIICGATNIAVGQKVPLAQIGTKISDFEIKESLIRGVKSCGMLCSEKELGIGSDHSGIKILADTFQLGKSLNQYIKGDLFLELEITTNRGDCLSHIGIAREIAAFSGKELINGSERNQPLISKLKTENASITDKQKKNPNLKIDIKSEDCQQYFGRIIDNVKIAPSPEWLQKRLINCGAKPINNVVDITNFILLDLGQPLHSFDADKVKDRHIIVRKANEYENIITLDGETRELASEDIVIADNEKALAIAGVMGGKNSEISESTTRVILESAEFDRKSIRKTAKRLKLVTEASYRYERGIDSGSVEQALNKATQMIIEIAGGTPLGDTTMAGKIPEKDFVEIKYDKINQLLGLSLKSEEIDAILISLGFSIRDRMAIIPLWRHDIDGWQDLAEEVGRIYGYGKINDLPVLVDKETGDNTNYHLKEYIKDILYSLDLSEVLNYSFLSENDAKIAGENTNNLLEVENPIQPENKYLRNSLIPGLLKSVAKNPAFDLVKMFEIGNIFSKDSESTNLGVIIAGKNTKKTADTIVEKLKSEISPLNKIDLKEINTEDLKRYKIKKNSVVVFELSIERLVANLKSKNIDPKIRLAKKNIHFRPVSRFPSVVRDIAFIVNKSVDSTAVTDLIYKQSDLINRVELFDEFSSDKFGVGKKNIAYHIDLQDLHKTLTDQEAEEVMNKITKSVEDNFAAKLRNY